MSAAPDVFRPFPSSFAQNSTLGDLTIWLSSPGGSLLWDLFLLALGILITVTVIRRYFEQREERRWGVASSRIYARLLLYADSFMSIAPWNLRSGLDDVYHTFGQQGIGSSDYDGDFYNRVVDLDMREFEPLVDHLSQQPDGVDRFVRGLARLSEPEMMFILSKDPELNEAIGELRERVLAVAPAFNRYLRHLSRGKGEHELGFFDIDTKEQVCITLSRVFTAAYHLRVLLIRKADSEDS